MQMKVIKSVKMSGSQISVKYETIYTSKCDLRPVGPLCNLRGIEDTRPKRVKVYFGKLYGWARREIRGEKKILSGCATFSRRNTDKP